MKYVVVRREETVVCSDTGRTLPKMDLKQDVAVLNTYEEAVTCFKQAIVHGPKYEWEEEKAADEALQRTYQAVNRMQNDSAYVMDENDMAFCEVGDMDTDKQYCLVDAHIIKLADLNFSSSRYLATNVHDLAHSQNGFYIFRNTHENIFSGEIETTTFSLTVTPVEDEM